MTGASFHNPPDRGDADGLLLVVSIVGIVAVVIAARWGVAGLVWAGVVVGLFAVLFALMVLFSGLGHGGRG